MTFNGHIKAQVVVKNVGARKGETTVQLYLHQTRASVARPVLSLRGFRKVALEPGEAKTLEFNIGAEDLKFYDVDLKFKNEPGLVEVLVGENSAQLEKATFVIK